MGIYSTQEYIMSEFYDQIRADLITGERHWRKVDYKTAEWRIECVPLVRGGYGACLCGESLSTTLDGQAIYLALIERSGQYYGCYATRKEWDDRLIGLDKPFPKINFVDWVAYANQPIDAA
jgi:hypothetical protein